MQGVGAGALEALGLADDWPHRYACVFLMIAVGRENVRGEGVLRSFEKLSGYVWTFILFLIFQVF